jgi:hypothetical protein
MKDYREFGEAIDECSPYVGWRSHLKNEIHTPDL